MDYKQCCVCGLLLPINMMQPIQVKHQGKIIVVGICNRCKEIKENEAIIKPTDRPSDDKSST